MYMLTITESNDMELNCNDDKERTIPFCKVWLLNTGLQKAYSSFDKQTRL